MLVYNPFAHEHFPRFIGSLACEYYVIRVTGLHLRLIQFAIECQTSYSSSGLLLPPSTRILESCTLSNDTRQGPTHNESLAAF